jgi:hypothetical protein
VSNLFLVKSPLQLLNAIEASNRFPSDKDILIIRFTSNNRTNSQLKQLLSFAKWDTILQIRYSKLPLNFIKEYHVLRKLIRSENKFENIFIGDYRLLNFKIFPINLKHKKAYLLDDGTSTFTIQEFYLKDQKEFPEKPVISFGKKVIAQYLFGFKTHLEERIHLFTCYNIEPHIGQEIVKNDYSYTRTHINARRELRIDKDKVYFIGAKYVESNLMLENEYFLILKKIREAFNQKKFIYIPHRGERESKLKDIEGLGIDIVNFSNIVEIELLYGSELPGIICGLTSSVLVNIPKIYPKIKVMAYKVNEEFFLPSYRQSVKSVYRRFESEEGLVLSKI